MDIAALVRREGGVVLTVRIADAGVPVSRISAAVRSGVLERPSRGWVALPDADPSLKRAAEAGVVLTCVTAAARRGLWDVNPRQVHVGLAPNAKLRAVLRAHHHWCKPVIPRRPGNLVDPVENALAIVADCQPFEDALAIWESALRQNTVALETLRTLPLSPQGRRLLDESRPFADAGTESIVCVRLRWLKLPMQRQAWILGHRVDLLIGKRLVIQIDGGHHVDMQRASDNEHDARLLLAGYHVIRVTYWQLMHDWHTVEKLILDAIARSLHLA